MSTRAATSERAPPRPRTGPTSESALASQASPPSLVILPPSKAALSASFVGVSKRIGVMAQSVTEGASSPRRVLEQLDHSERGSLTSTAPVNNSG